MRNRSVNPSPNVMTLFSTKEWVLNSESCFCNTVPKTLLFKETTEVDGYIIHGSPGKQSKYDIGIGEGEKVKKGKEGRKKRGWRRHRGRKRETVGLAYV